ncbi:MAG: MotA/TolQ/ExbB proton channel family protein [Phycisphaera sp. TMED9]|nr:MAG: MotA/TolQ/ExbB proton channel family protein [Phycisphaera sp. TMED9]
MEPKNESDTLGLWGQAVETWMDGGWAMIPLAVVAFIIFGLGTDLYMTLRGKGFKRLSESAWREWIDAPDRRRGRVGRIIEIASAARTISECEAIFEAIRLKELSPIRRSLLLMRTCVGAAPLLGLLGTVTGMLATFTALATGSGGDKTMGLIASGISEALITTETGLVIALPGVFFQYQMNRTFERYRAFLAQLESVFTQKIHQRQVESSRLAA